MNKEQSMYQSNMCGGAHEMKLFLLEDDDAIGMGLKYSLEKEGYEVVHVKTKADAEGAAKGKL